jgi:hypothetical protein
MGLDKTVSSMIYAIIMIKIALNVGVNWTKLKSLTCTFKRLVWKKLESAKHEGHANEAKWRLSNGEAMN